MDGEEHGHPNTPHTAKFPAHQFCAARDRRQDPAADAVDLRSSLDTDPLPAFERTEPETGINRSRAVRPRGLTRPRSFRNDKCSVPGRRRAPGCTAPARSKTSWPAPRAGCGCSSCPAGRRRRDHRGRLGRRRHTPPANGQHPRVRPQPPLTAASWHAQFITAVRLARGEASVTPCPVRGCCRVGDRVRWSRTGGTQGVVGYRKRTVVTARSTTAFHVWYRVSPGGAIAQAKNARPSRSIA